PAPKPVAAPAAAGAVVAPLAGKVVAIDTKVGDAVKEGDQILTLEAMKMNTYIYADRAGKIASINVAVGDGVEEGQALVTIA
ncbi:MAG: acetyl-CoA carboxylase biotin carboxyl carrier protein subunit, partial [Opitutales bacterium]|nr:acetyl-CoA carboxylase biotin carboxyl carrier protein subunit [Opitutales bacterium]